MSKNNKEFFIGIDSDGCVFDTMELKHKECFCPETIYAWNLQPISRYVRKEWETINLYSKYRGISRFKALVLLIERLSNTPEIKKRNFKLPDLSSLSKWVSEESNLSESSLSKYLKFKNDNILEITFQWSQSINESIKRFSKNLLPFPGVKEAISKLYQHANIHVISQTPVSTLLREWQESKLIPFVNEIFGQENGTKTEQLSKAMLGKYDKKRTLMIGDAIGDLEAAQKNEVLFYPIIPGREVESWKRLKNEAIKLFINNRFSEDYQKRLIKDLYKSLSISIT